MSNIPADLRYVASHEWIRLEAPGKALYSAMLNEALADAPEQVNGEPYAAWFFKLQPSNPAELEALLDAAGYQAVCSADA